MGKKYKKIGMSMNGHHNGPVVNVRISLKKYKKPPSSQSPNDCNMQMKFLVKPRISFESAIPPACKRKS